MANLKLDALPPPSDNSSHDLSDVPPPSDVDNEADMDDLLPPTDTESEVEVIWAFHLRKYHSESGDAYSLVLTLLSLALRDRRCPPYCR